MKLLYVTLLFIIPYNILAQNKSMDIYYSLINKAELNIIDSNYSMSSHYYDSAFSLNKFPFSKDIYNAVVIKILLQEDSVAAKYMERLATLGFDVSNFKSNPLTKFFWEGKYAAKVLNYSKTVKPVYSYAYRKEIENIVERDQLFRVKPNAYQLYDDTIRKIDKENVIKMQQLINRFGFPSEYKIGVQNDNVITSLFNIFFLHQSSGSYQIFNFSQLLKDAVINGVLDNKIAANLIMREDGMSYYDALGILKGKFDTVIVAGNEKITTSYETDWGYIEVNDEQKNKYDKKRKEIFLEPYNDHIRKILFLHKYPNLLLGIPGAKNAFKYKTYADYLHLKKNLKFL